MKYLSLIILLFIQCTPEEEVEFPPYPECTFCNDIAKMDWTTAFDFSNSDTLFFRNGEWVEVMVISSDKEGNWYQKLQLQEQNNGGKNAQILLGQNNLYLDFPFGSRLSILLDGLVAYKNDNGVYIGYKNEEGAIVSLPTFMIKDYVFNPVINNTLIEPIVIDDPNKLEQYLGNYVVVPQLQFFPWQQQFNVQELNQINSLRAYFPNLNSLELVYSSFSVYNLNRLEAKSYSVQGVVVRRLDGYAVLPNFWTDFVPFTQEVELDITNEISISELYELPLNTNLGQSYTLKGRVISNQNAQNFPFNKIAIQSDDRAITVEVTNRFGIQMGDEVVIFIAAEDQLISVNNWVYLQTQSDPIITQRNTELQSYNFDPENTQNQSSQLVTTTAYISPEEEGKYWKGLHVLESCDGEVAFLPIPMQHFHKKN